MSALFQFKKFNVDQSGCAMKINTDGVLLGAIVDADNPESILDIGTGTGVIALMLAQRFKNAKIDAVEIDVPASQTAYRNFKNAPFAERLNIFPFGFEEYFQQYPESKYDLIVSNPPFYIYSLKAPDAQKSLAKHTDVDFFEKLIKSVAEHLTVDGYCWLIVPLTLNELIVDTAVRCNLYPVKNIAVRSYSNSESHRTIICLSFNQVQTETSNLTIYETINIYTDEYKQLLKPYFLAF